MSGLPSTCLPFCWLKCDVAGDVLCVFTYLLVFERDHAYGNVHAFASVRLDFFRVRVWLFVFFGACVYACVGMCILCKRSCFVYATEAEYLSLTFLPQMPKSFLLFGIQRNGGPAVSRIMQEISCVIKIYGTR